jgi:cytochrome c556
MKQLVIRMQIAAAAVVLVTGFLLAQAPQAAPKPAADLNQLMRALFFPHSNVVFATQRQDPAEIKRAPEPSAATDPLTGVFGGWDAVENSALLLIDGADLLMTPGRTCSNGKSVPLGAPDWVKLVDDVRAAGKVAYEAARSKNIDRMFEASEVLNTACANCHNKYRRATRCQ